MQRTNIKMTADFSYETMQTKNDGATSSKYWKKKTQPRLLYPLKCDGFYRKVTTADTRSIYKNQIYFYIPAIKYQTWKFKKLTNSSINIMKYWVWQDMFKSWILKTTRCYKKI